MSAKDRLNEIMRRIDEAAKRARRDPKGVELIAVSKTKSASAVEELFKAGARNFGENYVQEAMEKKQLLEEKKIDPSWHFIGSLQTNKAKLVAGEFDLIHSVDRLELAQALDRRCQERGCVQPVLIQVNLGNEETKGGISPEQLPRFVDDLKNKHGLELKGLMALPPLSEDSEESRKFFRQMFELKEKWGEPSWHLSMGTTHDFEVAIEEGATLVRIGTALFGPREKKAKV